MNSGTQPTMPEWVVYTERPKYRGESVRTGICRLSDVPKRRRGGKMELRPLTPDEMKAVLTKEAASARKAARDALEAHPAYDEVTAIKDYFDSFDPQVEDIIDRLTPEQWASFRTVLVK